MALKVDDQFEAVQISIHLVEVDLTSHINHVQSNSRAVSHLLQNHHEY